MVVWAVWVVWASSRFEVNGTSAQAQLSRAVPRQTACPALLLQHGFGRSPVMWCGVAAGDALLHRHARAARWRRVVQNSRLAGPQPLLAARAAAGAWRCRVARAEAICMAFAGQKSRPQPAATRVQAVGIKPQCARWPRRWPAAALQHASMVRCSGAHWAFSGLWRCGRPSAVG